MHPEGAGASSEAWAAVRAGHAHASLHQKKKARKKNLLRDFYAFQQRQKKETELKRVFEIKQRKAANLEPLREQLKEMKESFGNLLRLLPNKTEIEGLLVDISQSGLSAGLEFEPGQLLLGAALHPDHERDEDQRCPAETIHDAKWGYGHPR